MWTIEYIETVLKKIICFHLDYSKNPNSKSTAGKIHLGVLVAPENLQNFTNLLSKPPTAFN